MTKLQKLALVAFIFDVLLFIPSIGILGITLGIVFTILVYMEMHKQHLTKNATKLYIYILLLNSFFALAVIPMVMLFYLVITGDSENILGNLWKIELAGKTYGVGLGHILAVLGYVALLISMTYIFRLSSEIKQLSVMADNSLLFRFAAGLLKVSAITMPILIGLVFYSIAQIFIQLAILMTNSYKLNAHNDNVIG